MAQSSLYHVAFVSGMGFTHTRPALYFCAQMTAKFSNLFMSFYISQARVSQAEKYLATHHPVESRRIRIVSSAAEAIPRDPLGDVLRLERAFHPWITDETSRNEVEINGFIVKAPSCVIADLISGGVALPDQVQNRLPVVYWWAGHGAHFLSSLGGKECSNGYEYYEAKTAALAQQPTEPHHDVVPESHSLVRIPGFPTYYAHEQVTQDVNKMLPLMAQFRRRWSQMLERSNKVVLVSTREMEPIAAEALTDAFSKSITIFHPGLAANLPRPRSPGITGFDASDPVISFMNRAYIELGAYSVVYIGFGTLWFPPPESAAYLKILIDELIARRLRIVFSLNPRYAQVSTLEREYIEGLTQAGHAMFPEWVQQLDVLEHPALHYFVSHGGWNSTTEAIVRGVPMIFWPIVGDQPINAVLMTRHHDCGFELLQVRTGLAKNVAFSEHGDIQIIGSAGAVRDEICQVLEMIQGERGKKQRRNVKSLADVVRKAVEVGGSVDVALEELGKAIGL